MAAILADARELQAMGVQEINLIAQDSTNYGADLGLVDGLAGLLEQLTAVVPEIPWIRVLYAFPGYLTPRLMEVMAAHPQILPYIDIPLQHADPGMLRRMLRPPDMEEVRSTIARLREILPQVAIRTTFITGFPGETEAEFQTLLDFVREMRFDRVGVFTYSAEEGTPAAVLPDDVPTEVKEARREALMLAQQNISLQSNQSWVGRKMEVLLEGQGDGMTVGRSYRDAPEIDGLVLIPGDHAIGRIVSVEITEALVYDLMGRISV
jgi:ribosomal protein S12 methylthiotransferase